MSGQRSLIDTVRIFVWGPVARWLYRRREKARFNRRYPVRWMTPRQLMAEDWRDYKATQKEHDLCFDNLDKLAKHRDDLASKRKTYYYASMAIMALLVALTWNIKIKIPVFGVEIPEQVGAREGLLFLHVLIGLYLLVQSIPLYTIESAMRFIISERTPIEMNSIYNSMYFPDKTQARYIPRIKKSINMMRLNYIVTMVPLVTLGLSMFAMAAIYQFVYLYIMYDIYRDAEIAYASKTVTIAAAALNIGGLFLAFSTHLPLPYQDFAAQDELEALRDTDADEYHRRLYAMHEEGINDAARMKELGYMKEGDDAGFKG